MSRSRKGEDAKNVPAGESALIAEVFRKLTHDRTKIDKVVAMFAWLRLTRREPETEWYETEDEQVDPFNPFPAPVTIEITDVFDLHTIPPRDVKRVVEEYLRQAHDAGFPSVRIIHGKGIGVQREMVRTILARTSFVEDWTDAPPDAGGLGATVVRFSPGP